MKKPISEFTDQESLRTIMVNAKRSNRDDVWREAFTRLCAREGLDEKDPLVRDFCTVLAAYEELLAEKHGHKTAASYTRRKLKNKGVVQCLKDWALATKVTEGFELLVVNGMVELTGEYLVVKHSQRFGEKAVAAARERLAKYGVATPELRPSQLR